jgi:hypothetical protein
MRRTDEERKEVVAGWPEARAAGATQAAYARQHGISERALRLWLGRLGGPWRTRDVPADLAEAISACDRVRSALVALRGAMAGRVRIETGDRAAGVDDEGPASASIDRTDAAEPNQALTEVPDGKSSPVVEGTVAAVATSNMPSTEERKADTTAGATAAVEKAEPPRRRGRLAWGGDTATDTRGPDETVGPARQPPTKPASPPPARPAGAVVEEHAVLRDRLPLPKSHWPR